MAENSDSVTKLADRESRQDSVFQNVSENQNFETADEPRLSGHGIAEENLESTIPRVDVELAEQNVNKEKKVSYTPSTSLGSKRSADANVTPESIGRQSQGLEEHVEISPTSDEPETTTSVINEALSQDMNATAASLKSAEGAISSNMVGSLSSKTEGDHESVKHDASVRQSQGFEEHQEIPPSSDEPETTASVINDALSQDMNITQVSLKSVEGAISSNMAGSRSSKTDVDHESVKHDSSVGLSKEVDEHLEQEPGATESLMSEIFSHDMNATVLSLKSVEGVVSPKIGGSHSSKLDADHESVEHQRSSSGTLKETSEDERRPSQDSKRHVRLSLESEIHLFQSDDELMTELEMLAEEEAHHEEIPDLEHLFDLDEVKRKSELHTLDDQVTRDQEKAQEEGKPEQPGSPSVSLKSIKSILANRKSGSVHISEDFLLEHRPTTISPRITLSNIDIDRREKSLDMATIAEEEEEVEKPEEVAKVQEERSKESIDRKMYYELYQLWKTQNNEHKVKNNYLQTRLAAYYMRRKMFYVLREASVELAEIQFKYEYQLEDLERLIESSDRDKEMNLSEVAHLTNKRDSKVIELNEKFDRLQHAELEHGKSLTFERTGKLAMDKVVERFVRRQKSQTSLLMKLRLTYIKLRNKITEKTIALDKLDYLGPGYRIMDYVQLKSDNKNLYDKLEEKENELTKLRKTCQNTMQILAHNREKAAVMDLDIGKSKEDLEALDMEQADAREQVHYLKRERDALRRDIKELRLEYGLLTHPKMLRDMESAIGEIDAIKSDIEYLEAGYREKSKQIIAVRRNMEHFQQKKLRDEQRKERQQRVSVTSSMSWSVADQPPPENHVAPYDAVPMVVKRVKINQ